VSLLGIDVGTTGCQGIVFSLDGKVLASAYEEYDVQRYQSGFAELDTARVWEKVKAVIQAVATGSKADPIQALSVSSLGEAFVPVTDTVCYWVLPTLTLINEGGVPRCIKQHS